MAEKPKCLDIFGWKNREVFESCPVAGCGCVLCEYIREGDWGVRDLSA